MRAVVIVNPVSGARGRRHAGARRRALAQAVLAAEGLDGAVTLTRAAGETRRLARDALDHGAALVVAWGGDGTVNEVASVLAGTSAALGLVPAGSGNGLARALGVPRDPGQALRAAIRGVDRPLDMGELGGRLFVNVAGIGLDAEVAARFNARAPGRRGLLPYLAIGLRAALTTPARSYTLRIDGAEATRRALLVVCANGPQYGGGARVAPDARLDDGALDLVVVEDRGLLGRLCAARRLFVGSLADAPGVLVERVRTFEVAADAPLSFHVDGEPAQGGATLAGRVHPGALRVRVASHEPAIVPPRALVRGWSRLATGPEAPGHA